MKENLIAWNKTLKFSWGHIIAFVAIIFLSYIMYMGCFYSNGGDFKNAAIKVGIIDLAILLTFIGAQVIKGTDNHFSRSIVIERVLVCLCPLVFIIAMIPYNYFWNIYSEREQVEKQFNTSIIGAKQMFQEYDDYANKRIKNYENVLDEIQENDESFSDVSKENYLRTLKLQLFSQNKENLTSLANDWIDSANSGASVWNAFLIGNIQQISDAINSWNNTLVEYSSETLSNETLYGNEVTPYAGTSYKQSVEGINKLKDVYVSVSGISVNTIWTGIIIFIMLLFPYMLQERNTRAHGYYHLLPNFLYSLIFKKSTSVNKNTRPHDSIDIDDDDTTMTISDPQDGDDVFGGTF